MAKAGSRRRAGINRFFKMSTGAVELMSKRKEERDTTTYVREKPGGGFTFVARTTKGHSGGHTYLNNLYMNIKRFREQGIPAVVALAKAYIEALNRNVLDNEHKIKKAGLTGAEVKQIAEEILRDALKKSNEYIFSQMKKYQEHPDKYKETQKAEAKMLDELRESLNVNVEETKIGGTA